MALIILLHCCQVELALPAALNHHACHLKYQKSSPRPPPPHSPPPHQPTAILRQPLMEDPLDVSLKNHLLCIFIQPPTPSPVPHPLLRQRTTVINIQQGDAVRECYSLSSPSTKGPPANDVHPWQPPWRDPVSGMRSLKHDTGSRPDLSFHISIYPAAPPL